jgi:hypothetical protein
MSITRWLTALLAALLLFTGCTTDEGNGDADEPTPTTEETGEPIEVALPDGYQWVTAERSGVRFAVPDTWIETGPDYLNDPDSQAELQRFADNLGVTMEDWTAQLAQVDVMVLSPSGEENINVMPPGPLTSLPSEQMIQRDFAALGATIVSIDDAETPIGPGRVAIYTLPLSADEEVHGASIFVETDNGIVNLTGTTQSLQSATNLTARATSTLSYAE